MGPSGQRDHNSGKPHIATGGLLCIHPLYYPAASTFLQYHHLHSTLFFPSLVLNPLLQHQDSVSTGPEQQEQRFTGLSGNMRRRKGDCYTGDASDNLHKSFNDSTFVCGQEQEVKIHFLQAQWLSLSLSLSLLR